jgi:predicted transglutaminase-like cysteine proteinase
MDHARQKQFRVFSLAVSVLLLAISNSAHAQPWSQIPAIAIPSGRIAPPPLGYLDFCQRHADQCGPDSQRSIARAADHGLAFAEAREDRLIPSSTGGTGFSGSSFDWRRAFAAMKMSEGPGAAQGDLQAAIGNSDENGLNHESGDHSDAVPDSIAMTHQTWQQFETVNREVNVGVRSVSDITHYGVEDYWELPFEGGNGAGDCEDYVLQKRKILMSQGVAMNALSIALVKTSWNEPHAVLLVRTDKGDYVLDNLTPLIKPWKSVAYTWIKLQSRNDPDVWVRPALE